MPSFACAASECRSQTGKTGAKNRSQTGKTTAIRYGILRDWHLSPIMCGQLSTPLNPSHHHSTIVLRAFPHYAERGVMQFSNAIIAAPSPLNPSETIVLSVPTDWKEILGKTGKKYLERLERNTSAVGETTASRHHGYPIKELT